MRTVPLHPPLKTEGALRSLRAKQRKRRSKFHRRTAPPVRRALASRHTEKLPVERNRVVQSQKKDQTDPGAPSKPTILKSGLDSNSYHPKMAEIEDSTRSVVQTRLNAAQAHCELFGKGLTIVTAVGVPMDMDDNFVRHRLRAYGQVEASRFMTYANLGFPEIKSGTRQYQMKLQTHIPGSFRIGNELVMFRYSGQPKLCHKCGSDQHFVAECTAVKCGKCGEIGHRSDSCQNEIKCNICAKTGHAARACPLSFANRLSVGTSWARPQNKTKATDTGGQGNSQTPTSSKEIPSGSDTNPKVPSGSDTNPKVVVVAATEPAKKATPKSTPLPSDSESESDPYSDLPEDGANKMTSDLEEEDVTVTGAKETDTQKSLHLELPESGDLMMDTTGWWSEGEGESKRRHNGGSDSDEPRSKTPKNGKDKKKPQKVESDGESAQITEFPSSPEVSQKSSQPPQPKRANRPGPNTDLRVMSLNVNGMKDVDKRRLAFDFCRNNKIDIAALQECHVASIADKIRWSRQWRGKSLWFLGTNSARGVGVLLSPRVKLISSRSDTEGRVVSALIEYNETRYNVANLYAPCSPAERATFFENVHQYLFPNASLILLGDFNCVLDPDLDRYTTSVHAPGTRAQDVVQLSDLCEDLGLKDAWRSEFPSRLDYTWRSPTNNSRSRLDRIYVPSPAISSSEIIACPFSDHDAVLTSLTLEPDTQMGPGVCKCNVKVLEDVLFDNEFKDLYPQWRAQKGDLSWREWWDSTKRRIKDLVSSHSKRRYEEAKDSLNKLNQERMTGQRLRSRIQHIENDEKPSRLFFKTERQEGQKKVIKVIRKPDGVVVDTPEEILDTFQSFYSKLYEEGQIDMSEQKYFLNQLQASLQEESKDALERDLTLFELEEALKDMANNKSPGSDGLPREFYLRYWEIIGRDILEVFKEGLAEEQLSPLQREGVITLLEKPGEKLNPVNRRPISLLNVDYKILTKALANRLKVVAAEVVHRDQSCGILGRSIVDSVTPLRDIAAYANYKAIPCVFLALDQEKAFDRVDHQYMVKVLEHLGFGPRFQSWIKTLYQDVSSRVLVNGLLSSPVSIERKPLAAAIRADKGIKGIQLPGGAGRETKRLVIDIEEYSSSEETIEAS
ncbi:hypothetical protein Bbelb_011230 [Branchiostoma belcheri]|nr:hypothetical protein Bbelb_011230 [Branchiostoma belcheri]